MSSVILTCALVLIVALAGISGIGILNVEAQSSHSINLTIYQSARPDVPLPGARILFKDVHTGEAVQLVTNSEGQAHYFPANYSYYSILINATGFYNYQYLNPANNTEYIRFDGSSDVNLRGVFLSRLPQTIIPVTLHLNDTPPAAVQVSAFYADGVDQLAFTANMTADLVANLQPGNYRIAYRGAGIQPGVVAISVRDAITVPLDVMPSTQLSVILLSNGSAVRADAYLVSRQAADLDRMIVRPTISAAGLAVFDAYPGQFYLLARANGLEPVEINVTLPGNEVTVHLDTPAHESRTVTAQFNAWNDLRLSVDTNAGGGSSDPGLDLSYLPSIRMQLDLSPTVGGNRNGIVDPQELQNYTAIRILMGPQYLRTAGLLTVDASEYISSADPLTYSLEFTGLLSSPVWSMQRFSGNLTAPYFPLGTAPSPQVANHLVSLHPLYQTAASSYLYHVLLPPGNVLLSTLVSKDPLDISLSGYANMTVAAPTRQQGYPESAVINLPTGREIGPSATASVVSSRYAYRVNQDTYIVQTQQIVTFSASGSFDPNGNPLQYAWDFGDGASAQTGALNVDHVYAQPAVSLPASLTVTDVMGSKAVFNMTIKADGVPPTPVILINATAPGPTVNVDQLQSVEYSASGSYDRIYNESVPQGIVKRVDWDFGDGTFALDSAVAHHAYLLPGHFNMTVTLTDASGRVTANTYLMNVRDVVGPNVVVSIMRAADGTPVTGSATVGDALIFDGANSTDPGGIVSYSWDFGDGSGGTGVAALHTYSSVRTVTGRLTCMDAAGNSGHHDFTLTVLPMPGPDLRATSMGFDPASFTEGSGGTVTITVVNVGSAVARNLSTGFYLVQAGGDSLLVRISGITVGGSAADHLDIGQQGTVTASLGFAGQGSYVILANCTADGELNPGDNSISSTLQVQENAWKYAGIYFGVILLVVVVIALLYMRRGATTKKKRKQGKKGGKK